MANPFDIAEGKASSNPFDVAEETSKEFDPSKIKLNPYDEYYLTHPRTGGIGPTGVPMGSEMYGSGDPIKALQLSYQGPGRALEYLGGVARAIPADVAAGFRGESEYSGNIPAAIMDKPLPIDEALDEAAKESAHQGGNAWESTLGHVSQDIAASAPLLFAAGAPVAIQRALLAGFTADMLRHAPEIAREYGEELGKNPQDQDPAKLARLKASAIGTTGGVVLGAAGLKGMGKDVPITLGDRIRMFERDIPKTELPDLSFRDPNRRLGLPVSQNVLERPGVPELVERGLEEAQGARVATPTEVPAVDLLRRFDAPITSELPGFESRGGPLATPRDALMERPSPVEPLTRNERRKYEMRTPEENEMSLRSAENIRLEEAGGIPKREGKPGGPETTFEVPAKTVEEQLLGEGYKGPEAPPEAPGAAPGTPPQPPGGGVSPAVETFRQGINNPEVIMTGNKLSTATGLGVKSLADLEALAKLRRDQAKANADFKAGLENMPKEQRLAALQEYFKTAPDQKAQLAREAIEVATDTGSWQEATTSADFKKLGERPLDWKKNPEVADWLKANAEDLGIKLPDDFKRAVEPAKPVVPGDALIETLEGMKLNRGMSAEVGMTNIPEFIKSYGAAVWDTALDIAIQSIKAGRAINDAVGEAMTYLKKNSKNVDEKATRDYITSILEKEKPAPASPGRTGTIAPTPGAAAPAAASGAGAPPAATPPVTPGGAARPAPAGGGRGGATLDDVYKIFEPEAPKGPSIGQRASNIIEAVRTGVSSRFRPLEKLAEDIGKAYGVSKTGIAGIFEQLKGSSGKGEADVYRFDRDVSKLVRGKEKDFSPYMFLRRGIDRLQQDLLDIQRAQAGANIPKLNRRSVGQYTIPELQAKLSALEAKLGPETVQKFQQAADLYQQHMDKALRLQVESGRMSPQVYNAIKAGNQFYAPFKMMKYLEETAKPEGSGRRVDTMADFTKAMEGIESPEFKLGDMLAAGRQNILMSRILAEKNFAMRKVSDLAAIDTNGQFIKKLAPKQDAPKGMEIVNILEGGKQQRYAVDPTVSQALQMFGETGGNLVTDLLAKGSVPFRAGATALNLPFQVSNILADTPRASLVSRYGARGVSDLVRYPLEFIESAFSSMLGNVAGYKNKLYLDFLDSGVAGGTIQEHLTPKALRTETQSLPAKVGQKILYAIPDFAQAIEQTSKILGVKRAMRFEGATSGAELSRRIPEAITEIRRFSGSPDFGRQGRWVEQGRLNLLYMFLNARIQGAVADLGRLTGRDGAGTAAKTWAKILPAVGIPTAYLYLLNNSDEYAKDYAQRPAQEKQNYWLIPKDSYITANDGSKMRDYWRIPKRESSKWIANMVESGLNFAENRTPQTFGKWAQNMIEDISPVNIQGDTLQERMESTASSLNPLIKAPLEVATGRDMYRHKDIVPETQQKASPENQYTDRTAEVFKQAANAMPDVAPEFMRSPLMLENMTKNLTAGLITQFLPRKPIEGRSETENNPLLSRFQALPYTDSTEFEEKMAGLERDSADDQLNRYRTASKLLEDNKGKPIQDIAKDMVAKHGPDKKLLERTVDLWVAEQRGITSQERRVLALPVAQRAVYISNEIKNLAPEQKGEALRDFAAKRILTEPVAEELIRQQEK